MKKFIPLIIFTCFLTGCGDSYSEIKEAVSGINTKANDAASALTIEVHKLRATELHYNDKSFTINDLFKTTLRDVQWHYDEKDKNLKITGTWKNNGLFAHENFEDATKEQLQKNGEVEVHLFFNQDKLEESKTTVKMQLNSNKLIDIEGKEALEHFYAVYVN